MQEEKLCAVVLAAGKSSRMGQLKQLMPLQERPLLEHAVQKALDSDFTAVYTVLGYEAGRIKREIDITDERHHWLFNEKYEYGQSTSIKKALMHIMGHYDHVMIMLGDLPFIKGETLEMVKARGKEMCAAERGPFIVRPVHRGEAGHPVFIGNISRDLVEQLDGDQGFKPIKNLFAARQLIETDDDGVIFDIDTGREYREAAERAGSEIWSLK